jgi:rhamnogalacturonyl hydrolase YesR
MTGLRADGRFHEPNLDGTPGDYVSFDSWEWPQGVGLYSLVKLWKQTGDPALLATARRLVRPPHRRRLAGDECQHHGADAGAERTLAA